MPRKKPPRGLKPRPLSFDFDWTSWTSRSADIAALEPRLAARLLFDVCAIQDFEHAVLELKNDDCVWGPAHTSVGQEAIAAASAAACRLSDKWTGTHRAHHQYLAKALQYAVPATWDAATEALPEAGTDAIFRGLAEIMGLKAGHGGGRGGSMHLRWKEAGFLGSNAIVAGGVPLSVGVAYAEKFRQTGDVMVAFFGDGAINQGAFHEAANLAGAFDLPVIFFLENNDYAVATRIDDVTAVSDLALRAAAYGMPALSVNGSDIVALYHAMGKATELARSGQPVLIDAHCYRRYHHAGDIPGSNFKYRSSEEEDSWRAIEVVDAFPAALLEAGVLDQAAVDHIRGLSREAVQAAVEATTLPGKPRTIRAELIPDPATAPEGNRSDGSEFDGVVYKEREDFSVWAKLPYNDAIAAVTGRWLANHPEATVLGEEIANFGGGPYGATKALPAKYPDRIVNMPISEGGFVGLGLGMAMSGMPTVVEIMFPDFSFVAADQLFNQVAKCRHMYGNTTELPLVVRTRIATGCGYGGQHSMNPAALYALFSGWRICAPADAFDYIGLFNAAMRSLDPVLILEHHALYTTRFEVPEDDLDYTIELGKARRLAEGDDVTLITYGILVGRCQALLERWQAAGIGVDLIDLRTIDYPSIDYDLIAESVKKTGTVVIAEEACRSQALGHNIGREITERCFDWLDGPICCLTSQDVPPSVSRWLEAAVMIQDDEIERMVIDVAKRQWK